MIEPSGFVAAPDPLVREFHGNSWSPFPYIPGVKENRDGEPIAGRAPVHPERFTLLKAATPQMICWK
jgi:hypothetical protein